MAQLVSIVNGVMKDLDPFKQIVKYYPNNCELVIELNPLQAETPLVENEVIHILRKDGSLLGSSTKSRYRFGDLDAIQNEGQPNATALVEKWIAENRVSTQNEDRYSLQYARPDTRVLEVEDFQATDGGITDPPYPVIALRKKAGINNAAFIGLLSANNEQNDDYAIWVYRFNRDQIAARTGVSIAWSDIDTNLEGFEFPRTGTSAVTPVPTTDIKIWSLTSERNQNILVKDLDKPMEGDAYEYLITFRGHQQGADAFVSINPYSFDYQ